MSDPTTTSGAAAPDQQQHLGTTPVLAAVVAVVVWAIGPLIVRGVGTSGLTVAAYRLWIGAPIMFVILAVQRGRLDRRIWRMAGPAGFLFAADVALGFSSFRYTSLANASLIGALSPVFVLLASRPLFGERVRALDLLWIGLALVGTAMVVLGGIDEGERSLFGDALAVGSAFTWTFYFLYVKRSRVEGVPAFAFMTAVIAWAAVCITPMALVMSNDLGDVRGGDYLLIVLMALGPGAVGHGLMTWAHRYVPVNLSSLITLAGPVVTAAGAWLVYDERLTPVQGLGGLAVLGALAALVLGRERASFVPGPLEAE